MPDMAQRQVMNKVFEMTKSVGKYAAVPPEQIQQKAQEIAAELQRRMQPKTQSE
jgi:F420-0:gamma-glutamyl ligase-like protein